MIEAFNKLSTPVKVLTSVAATLTALTVIYTFLTSVGLAPITNSQAKTIFDAQIAEAEKRVLLASESNYMRLQKQQEENSKKLRDLETSGSAIDERTKNIQNELLQQRVLQNEILRELRRR